jgi:SAM-dependent methyltransferase
MAQARKGGGTGDPLTEADVAEIMRQVRDQASKQRRKFALSAAASPRRNSHMNNQASSQAAGDLGFLQSAQDLSQVRMSSHRKGVGNFIVLAKKVLQQLLTPIFERQSAYNGANARLMAYLCEQVPRLEGLVAQMEERVASALEARRAEETAFLDALRGTVAGQLETLAQQQEAALQALQIEVAAQSRDRRAQERHLTLLLDEMRKQLSEPVFQTPAQIPAGREMGRSDGFFAAFDERFRGNRTDIKVRLRIYLATLKEAQVSTADHPIIDLGCGRGEWLELLQEVGLRAKGVDRNPVLIEECRQYELDVVEGDILTYLCSLPTGSVAAVTGFHIVEHLPFDILLKMFDETVRVLQPGGVAIFETPNPQNILVSTHEFYIDPTHYHPMPSQLLRFIAEVKGLSRITLLHLHPFPETHKVQETGLEVAKRFNELFYGPRDYALIGWKV